MIYERIPHPPRHCRTEKYIIEVVDRPQHSIFVFQILDVLALEASVDAQIIRCQRLLFRPVDGDSFLVVLMIN